ncbi:KH domain-containing protein [Candidatus Gottesmanbacteria bacterium]|nr:KH domain-containing protein [Candidatus Gottesmanbacteria bacterium]
MKDTLLYMVTFLVDHPEEVSIEERVEGDATILIIHTHPEDIGKVIGKSGRIIRALRDLIKVLAAKANTFVDVEIAEDATRTPEASA